MKEQTNHRMFLSIFFGAVALLTLFACKPETGHSPLSTPEPLSTQDLVFTSPRPTPAPVTPWPTATLLPDHGVRMSLPVEVHPVLEQRWKHIASLALDGGNLVASIDDGTGKRLPIAIDLGTRQVQILDQNSSQAQIHDLHAFGHYVLWIASQDKKDTLYVRDMQTGQTSSIAEGAYDVGLSGTTVVWRQVGDGWDIWGYDLEQQKRFPIVADSGSQLMPLVSKRWIVFMNMLADSTSEGTAAVPLDVANIDSGKVVTMGSIFWDSHRDTPPLYTIDAPWVAWGTGQWSKTPDLHFYNLDTETSFTVTVPSCELTAPDTPPQLGRPEHLILSGNILFFRGCYQDLGYDIQRKVFFSLPTYTSEMQGSSWAGWAYLVIG